MKLKNVNPIKFEFIRNQGSKKKKKAINLSPIQINFQPAQDLVFWA